MINTDEELLLRIFFEIKFSMAKILDSFVSRF